MRDLTQIIKAYDVRGVYPDQLDAELAERVGAAFARVVGAEPGRRWPGRGGGGSRHAPIRARSSSRRSARGDRRRGSDVIDIGLASTDQLYFASGRLGPARGDVHREPQPGAVQRHQAVPRRGHARSGRTRAGRDPRAWSRPACRPPATRSGAITDRDLLADYAAFLHDLVDLLVRSGRCGSSWTPATGWPGTPPRRSLDVPGPGRRAAVLRARRHVPQPRGQPDRVRRTCATCRLRSSRRAPTSDWPSTATPTGASSSTSAASSVSPSALTGLVAARELRRAPGVADHPQPDHLPGRPRGDPRERRRPGAHPRGALVHQGPDGADGRGLRRRALGPLLLPGVLERRLRHAGRAAHARRAGRHAARARRCRRCWRPTSGYVASGEINSVVTDGAAATPAACALPSPPSPT